MTTAHPSATHPAGASARGDESNRWCVRRHLRVGWWSLALFVVLGLALELLHGFKAGLYLNASNETRRLLWTLAHAHGTLLALVHVAFALAVHLLPGWTGGSLRIASGSLLAASVLIPAGFFVGGIYIRDGDPGMAITLVPPGAILLLTTAILAARASATFSADQAGSP